MTRRAYLEAKEAFFQACRSGDLDAMRRMWLSKYLSSYFLADNDGSTPLHIAVAYNHVNMARDIIYGMHDPSAVDRQGYTASDRVWLYLEKNNTIHKKQLEIADLFLARAPVVVFKNYKNKTWTDLSNLVKQKKKEFAKGKDDKTMSSSSDVEEDGEEEENL